MKDIFLFGQQVNLRPLNEKDLNGDYVSWLNDPEVCAGNSHHRFPYGEMAAEDYIQYSLSSKNDLILAMVDKKTELHIGNIAIQKIDWINRCGEFAVLLGNKDYWGKGCSKEAGELIIKHAFQSLNLRRIYCATFATNPGMLKLAQVLGMKQEGCRREAVFKNGKYLDIVEFGLLKDEC